MAYVPLLMSGLGALGGLFGNRPQTSTQSGTSTSTTNPILDPNTKNLMNPLVNNYISLLNEDPNLEGYKTSQGQSIADLSNIQKNAGIENLAARGITNGAAPASVATGADNSRIAQMSQLSQSIPLLRDQLIQSLTQTGSQLFSSIPRGSQTTGQTQQTTNQPGNMLGGLFGNLGPIIAALSGMNFGGSGNNTTATTGGPAQIYT